MNQSDTNWKFFTSSPEAWTAMLEAIREAKVSIDLEQFILNYDSVGIEFLDALKERVSQGVKVRLLCDEVGSFSLFRSGISKELERLGIEIKFFNSIIPWSPNNETLWFFRDHRKLLIIDKNKMFTGGICLGDDMRNWRESSVCLSGSVVQDAINAFDTMWNKKYKNIKFYKKQKRLSPFPLFQYITNAPLPRQRFMYRELIRAINNAKHYIYLTTPYLLPDHRLFRALRRATKRKVEIRLLVPQKTESVLIDIASGTFYHSLLSLGIRLFRYTDTMIHAKTSVIDGLWSTIGSLNLDNLSLRYNFESNIVSRDKLFAFELEKQFLLDLGKSEELTLEKWSKRRFVVKLAEILIWPFRKLL